MKASAPGWRTWPTRPSRRCPTSRTGLLEHGFIWPSVKLAVLTENDLAGQPGSRPAPRTCAGCRAGGAAGSTRCSSSPGDYVVHEQHGVGRFVEMTSRTVGRGHPRVPGHRVRAEQARPAAGPAVRADRPARPGHQVRRRRGADACTGWAGRTGPRPRAGPARRCAQIAAELIRLYSARMASPGHAFGPDTPWQRELEDAFPYVETPDQLAAIDEVKSDMETADPDGPADLRRRRLRQDRDRGAGGVQGGPGRPAGRGAGADHAAGAAALLHVQRALRAVPGQGPGAVPVPEPGRDHGDAARAGRRRRSTWSSAPTGCCRPRSSSSGWA